MDDFREFRPARQGGLILHAGVLLLVAAACGGMLMLAMAQDTRGFLILYLIGCLIAFLPIPLILYRLFALLRSKYVIDREGFHIQWGLRTEDIPMNEIEWLRLAVDMPYQIPLPRFSVQGAILGVIKMDDLGTVEFLASDSSQLLLIACRNKVLVISPNDLDDFQDTFMRFAEMGSIAPIKARSSNAEFLLTALFKDKVARTFILLGISLALGLLIMVSFIVPGRDTINLGYNPLIGSLQEAPSERLLFLPIFSLFMLIGDLGLGSYLYRKEGFRFTSYFAFASSLIMPLSFFALILIFVL